MDRNRIRRLCGVIVTAAGLLWAATPAGEPDTAVRMTEILDELDRVALFYENNALRFTCNETVTHFANGRRNVYRYRYIYRYDEEGKLADYREPRGSKERRSPIRAVLDRAYNWVQVFRADKRHRFNYDLAEPTAVSGRTAIGVTFAPVPPFVRGVNDMIGTAWIDAETYQLLRVEALEGTEWQEQQRFVKSLAGASQPRREHRCLRFTV